MVDYANGTGIKTVILVLYSVDTVFNFAPSSVTLDFRTLLTILANYAQTWQHLYD